MVPCEAEVTFSTTSGSFPDGNTSTVNSIGVASLISNPLLISGPIVPFDAGTYTISASYGGDASFHSSSSSATISFTIQPGFVAVSGLAGITIASPGLSGTSTVGVVASSNITSAITFSCPASASSGISCSGQVTPAGPALSGGPSLDTPSGLSAAS